MSRHDRGREPRMSHGPPRSTLRAADVHGLPSGLRTEAAMNARCTMRLAGGGLGRPMQGLHELAALDRVKGPAERWPRWLRRAGRPRQGTGSLRHHAGPPSRRAQDALPAPRTEPTRKGAGGAGRHGKNRESGGEEEVSPLRTADS
jgi:hypothetical protein